MDLDDITLLKQLDDTDEYDLETQMMLTKKRKDNGRERNAPALFCVQKYLERI